MNWEEYCLARQVMAEERIGRYMREEDRADLEKEARGQAILRSQGLVG